MKKRIIWIDILKCFAVLGVILNHAFILQPYIHNEIVLIHSYFSIIWFIFLFGITSSISYNTIDVSFPKSALIFWKKWLYLPFLYIFFSAVIYFFQYGKSGTLSGLFQTLLNFDASPPYYFFYLLFQLILLFPFIYLLMTVKSKFVSICFSIIICFIALCYDIYSNGNWKISILNLIFAGPYLPVFIMGILYNQYKKIIGRFEYLFIIIAIIGEWMLITQQKTFHFYYPDLLTIVIGISILITCKCIIQFFDKKKLLKKPGIIPFIIIGQNSLIIFLIHYPILENVGFRYISPAVNFSLPVIISIIFPILIGILVRTTYRLFLKKRKYNN